MGSRMRPAMLLAGLLVGLLAVTLTGAQGEEQLDKVPSEAQCRPYIEKALKDLGTEDSGEQTEGDSGGGEDDSEEERSGDDDEGPGESSADADDDDDKSGSREKREAASTEADDDRKDEGAKSEENDENEAEEQVDTAEVTTEDGSSDDGGSVEVVEQSGEEADAGDSREDDKTQEADGDDSKQEADGDDSKQEADGDNSKQEVESAAEGDSREEDKTDEAEVVLLDESAEAKDDTGEDDAKSGEDGGESKGVESGEAETAADEGDEDGDKEEEEESKEGDDAEQSGESQQDDAEDDKKSVEEEEVVAEDAAASVEEAAPSAEAEGDNKDEEKSEEKDGGESKGEEDADGASGEAADDEADGSGSEDSRPEEEELIMEIEIPEVLRPREHVGQLLKLDEENEPRERATEKVADVVLRDLKRLYDSAIKPLETLYKYRDLSNRHFGDPEIFSKPLVLFMGPWSGGKSSIINYLLDIEYKPTSLRTGAEPSPAYFNIVMHGEEEEVLDGTQLAADWTFSGLQKFGQGLLDRLKGYKLKSKLLEKVNIVEIPGILEIRKQVQRLFPFNDACQWFIDRADIIFLVYDPSKLDVGPETEAILDQLKGREYQTRIILNKADQVKPEELMRVQGALIWNISPLMSSAEPPIMYSASLWSIPYEAGAPTRLLYAQERAFLRDLRSAVDKRVEHKIASARRFAVRVRNHAKMVDCYLTTYYNHKGFFARKKDISDSIIENPQEYHIYEGLSTLTNISRYDLPDPDVYRDFFRLNPLYDFPLLSSTCTYFRGCPINRLDVAIAYDLPELVGKYKKAVEAAMQVEAVAHGVEAAAALPPPATQQQKSGASRMNMS